MNMRRKRIGLKYGSQILLLSLSIMLVVTFQNCGSAIQVTDDLAGASILAEQNLPPGPPSPIEEPLRTPGPETPIIPPTPENPYDPATPGINLLPIQGEWSSIAFEDNLGNAEAGDRDYNDAVFNYKIAEQYNSQSMLVRIFMEVRLREKISDNNHNLHLAVNGNPTAFFDNITHLSSAAFAGEADAKLIKSNSEIIALENVRNRLITVFSSTSNRKGEVIKIELTLKHPELNVRTPNQNSVDYKKYRFILQNHGQNRKGIDIAEINPTDEMLSNANNYPFGFMIPANWQPPDEGQPIDQFYPHFIHYRTWLVESQNELIPQSEEAANWFNYQNWRAD